MCQPGRFLEAILAPVSTTTPWNGSRPSRPGGTASGCSTSRRRSAPATPAPRASTSAASRAGCSSRAGTSSSPTRPPGTVATRRAPTEAERRDLAFAWRVCAVGQVQRDRPGQGRPGRRRRRRPDEPARLGADRRRESRPAGRGARCWPPTPSSRSATAPTSPPPPASPPSFSPAARSATTRRSTACDEHGMAMILTGRRHFRH